MWEPNLISYSSQSIFFFNRGETFPKRSKIQIMFLSVVFFGNRTAVDIDVQTRIQPCLRKLDMGRLLPAGNTLFLRLPFLLQVENFFFFWFTKLTFKMPTPRTPIQICCVLSKVPPNSLWSLFISSLTAGTSGRRRMGKISGCSGPTVWTRKPR